MGRRPEPAPEPARAPLEPTGIPQLDLVLGGGLPRGALIIVLGSPGSGKTTLASQIAFAAARRGQRALILTAFSEPTIKLLEHLRGYRFFAPDLIGESLQVLSLQQFLSQGIDAAEQEILAAARQTQARWVVLDGFQGIRGLAPDERATRQLLYTLGTRLSVQGTTTLITAEADPRDPALFPEMTTGDVLLGLYFELNGVRTTRGLEVIKFRGREPLPGRHSFDITEEGVTVFPRLETRASYRGAPVEDSASPPPLPERASFGLPELDEMLAGGLTRRTSTLLAGSLGTGKTLLALHFALAGVSGGEPTLFLSFRETLDQLLARADVFSQGQRMRAALAPGGGLIFHRWEPIELDADQVAADLLATIERARVRRLVIDSIAELERAVAESAAPQRVPNYLAALLAALRTRGVTLLAIKETSKLVAAELDFSADVLSVLAENVMFMQQVIYENQLHRVLSILKMRFSSHDYTLREIVIAPPEGIRVLKPGESLDGLLDGLAGRQGRPGYRPTGAPRADPPPEGQGT